MAFWVDFQLWNFMSIPYRLNLEKSKFVCEISMVPEYDFLNLGQN